MSKPSKEAGQATQGCGLDEDQFNLQTECIHAGVSPDPTTGAILTPIYQTTTYVQEAVGKDKGYTYTRSGNPTVTVLEKKLASLEKVCQPAACFATGMAAITALFLACLKRGDHIICSDVVYGGTVRLLDNILVNFGISVDYVDTADQQAISQAILPQTKLIFIETPANPTLKLTDIAVLAKLAKQAGLLLAVDNTFLTAVLQKPLELGADIIVYSTTKYIDGHDATLGGALIANSAELMERFHFVQNSVGFSQSPFEAWLTLQGIKTLPLRLHSHCINALKVAEFLESHPKIKRVWYPGLASFPQYELACRQHQGHGGMIAFEVKGTLQAGIQLMNTVKLCSLAENLGAVETLITHPASMTHGPIAPEQRAKIGISDALVRLSVGLEAPKDIIQDLDQALAQINS